MLWAIRHALLAGLLCSLAIGCAQVRIPAIDPTGERFFSGTTTLESHGLFHHRRDAQPVAAVQPIVPVVTPQPAAPPPCNPPIAAVPVQPQPLVAVPMPSVPVRPVACGPQQMVVPGQAKTGGPICAEPAAYCGPELTVTPSRIVAPVNSEVILAAGIRSPDGYYVMRQPLEWMLAQDGVGQFVAVGHESPNDVSFLLRNSPQKVATNYARAHTSTISQTLNRGTASPGDDVRLQKGQSWITVTSPTEGTSHVVVWAPKEHNWERRKTTATIYWIDASWRFPPCAVARTGGGLGQPLTTVLMRSEGQPLAGWRVRYTVLEGPPAVFSARRNTVEEVFTDNQGRATAQLLPGSMEPGITMIGVQIIRPASGRGDLPEMIVGQGTTSVQWTTPGLTVNAIGTSSVAADGTISYRIAVTNGGDLMTRGVALNFAPPQGVTLLNSAPAAQAFGQNYQWRLGDLPPGTTTLVELNCRAAVSASVRSVFKATSTDGLSTEGRTTTEVFTNALSVKMTGPETAAVGSEVKFLIDVTNTGPSTLTNLVASDTFEPGLTERSGASSPAVRALPGALEPGQTTSFALTFVVSEAGRLSHRLDVTAEGGHRGSARSFVIGTQPVIAPAPPARTTPTPPPRTSSSSADSAPRLSPTAGSLKVTASLHGNPIRQGATTTCSIGVTNDRSVSDQEVTIAVQLVGDGLTLSRTPVKASETPAVRTGLDSIEFAPLHELRAGEALRPYRIELQGVKPGKQKIRVTVTSSRSPAGVVADAELTVVAP